LFFLFVLFEENLLRNAARAPALQQRCCSIAQRCWSTSAAALRNTAGATKKEEEP
jgi:hypothetical protein